MTVLNMIYDVVLKYPHAIALEEHSNNPNNRDIVLSYNELFNFSLSFAALIEEKFKNQQYIGLSLRKRSWKHIVGILAIMLSKKAFVMIDPAWPASRLNSLKNKFANERRTFAILTDSDIDDWFQLFNNGIWKQTIDFKNRGNEISVGTPAYCICSSGSTGEPKCIEVLHVGIPNLVENQQKIFESNFNSRFLWILSQVFDGSLSDIFVALSSGSTVVIDDRYDNFNLLDIALADAITHIDVPPSLLLALSEQTDYKINIPSLKNLIVGGEQLSKKVVETFVGKFGLRIVNVYGPTEATICTSAKVYDQVTLQNPKWQITIGKPFNNVIYNKKYNGELEIGGIQVANGYIGDQELTSQKFDYNSRDTRYFRTGDIVDVLPNGEWIFLKRLDRQFKLNGKLVAPEEIEAISMKLGVPSVVALVKNKIACLVETSKISLCELQNAYKESTLPEWSIPTSLVGCNQLPKLSNGKIDYAKSVSILSNSVVDNGSKDISPISSDKTLLEVKRMIMNIMKFKNLPMDDDNLLNFLHMDSIQQIMLAIKIKNKFKVDFGACDFKIGTTPAKVTELIKSKMCGNNGILASDLETKAKEFEADLYSKNSSKSQDLILLTGAAGFLGSHILKELLERTTKGIVCIVRAKDNYWAIDSVMKALKARYEGPISSEFNSRIHCLAGDLSKERFGLVEESTEMNFTYDKLCKRIKHVYHIAGEVNDWKSSEDLTASNIEATKNIVKFCIFDGNATLAFASTLSVFVSRSDLPIDYVCAEKPLDSIGIMVGGYAQSKWIAEKIVTDMMPTRAKVFRYGLLTEPIGKPLSMKKSTLNMFLRGATALKVLPKLSNGKKLKVDLTPVDIAAKATVIACLRNNPMHDIIHVHAGLQVTYDYIAKRLKLTNAIDDDQVDYDEWKKIAAAKATQSEDIIACIEAISREDGFKFGPFDLFQSTDVKFARDRMLENCTKDDYSCNQSTFSTDYLAQILRESVYQKNW